MPGGRPPKWESPDEIQPLIDAFFDECDAKDEPYTVTGLALAINLTRQGLCEYEAKPEFSDAIKLAKARCENFAEKRIYGPGKAAGPIFALKNYGWTDKQEIDMKANVTFEVIDRFDENTDPE